jgi:hypothetical protein
MKIKFSALVSDMRGKLNGSVLTKNRAGSAMRNKITGSNKRTFGQVLARANFSYLVLVFTALAQATQYIWNTFAESVNVTNVFGDSFKLTGQNFYVKYNSLRMLCGLAKSDTLPSSTRVLLPTALDIDTISAASGLKLKFTSTFPTGTLVAIFATRQMNHGRNPNKSDYRFIGYITDAFATGDAITSEYVAKFGALVAGKKISFFVKAVNAAGYPIFLPTPFATGISFIVQA